MTEIPMAQRGADCGDEAGGDERSDDGAEVVHGSFESVGPAVDRARDDVGEQRIAGGNAQSAGGPGARSQDADLPGGGGGTEARREHRGRGVAPDSHRAAAGRIVSEDTAAEAGGTGESVADALDGAERRRRRAECRGEQRREQRRRDLVTDIREKARATDAGDARCQPSLRVVLVHLFEHMAIVAASALVSSTLQSSPGPVIGSPAQGGSRGCERRISGAPSRSRPSHDHVAGVRERAGRTLPDELPEAFAARGARQLAGSPSLRAGSSGSSTPSRVRAPRAEQPLRLVAADRGSRRDRHRHHRLPRAAGSRRAAPRFSAA